MVEKPNDGSTKREPTGRRKFLALVGALGVTGLAGCGGDDGDGDAPTDTPTETTAGSNENGDTPTDTETDTPTRTETSTPTPTDVVEQPLGGDPETLVSLEGTIQVGPGAETTIAATLTNAYLFEIRSVEVSISAPDELEVSPTTDTAFDSVESQGTRSLEWDLVVPDATGEFELDVSVAYASNTDEADVSTTVPVVVSRTLQAENADEMTDSVIHEDHPGYNGDGFFNFDAETGARAVYSDIDGLIGEAGEKTITFRYALDGERTIALAVNGERRTEITFTTTGGWESWETLSVTAELESGDTIALETIGDEGPNLDQLTFADADG
jgi:hypothetical protein